MKQSKIGHYISIAYAAMVLFAIIGILFKPGELPALALVLTVLMWGASRIVVDGVHSTIVLLKGDKEGE